jgi:hypothetical protein
MRVSHETIYRSLFIGRLRITASCYGGRTFKKLKLHVPDPYDLILSKLQRASQKDPDDANYLFKDQKPARYTNELHTGLIGPIDRHDDTLERWIEIFGTAG